MSKGNQIILVGQGPATAAAKEILIERGIQVIVAEPSEVNKAFELPPKLITNPYSDILLDKDVNNRAARRKKQKESKRKNR